MTGFRLARISLARRPFPSILAIICLAVACVAADLILSSIRSQTSPVADLHSDYDLILGPKSSGTELLLGALGQAVVPPTVIPFALVQYLDRQDELAHRIPIYQLGRHEGIRVIGTDAAYWDRPEGFESPVLLAGRLGSASNEIVIGEAAAEELGWGPNQRVRIEISHFLPDGTESTWSDDLDLVGVARSGDASADRLIVLSLEKGWEHYRWALAAGVSQNTKNLEAISYALLAAKPGRLDAVESKIHEQSTVQIVRVEEELAFLRGIVRGADQASNLLCLFVFLLASLTAMVLVNSRFDSLKHELGLLRALGYRRGEIGSWLVLESLIPAAAAVLLAVGVEFVLYDRIGIALSTDWIESHSEWPAVWNFALWGLFLLSPAVASALPLYRLHRTDVREAMEGV